MQYSLFTHGNALRVENPGNLAGLNNFGWGTQIEFHPPIQGQTGDVPTLQSAPGSWFHLPLDSTLTTFRSASPRLISVTILFQTTNCRIDKVHVYDGARFLQEFKSNQFGFHGEFLDSRNAFKLDSPHPVFSAIGISFFAYADVSDFHPARPPFAGATLVVAGGGAQYHAQSLLEEAATTIFQNNPFGTVLGGG
jgi:hypothetical protein